MRQLKEKILNFNPIGIKGGLRFEFDKMGAANQSARQSGGVVHKETKKKYLVIFTGGLANIFFSSFPFKDKVIDQQITLKGIAETLKFNLKNI